MYRIGSRAINQTFYRLRLLVMIALTTGMRIAEIFALKWSDILYREQLIAVRSKLKGGKMRYAPMPLELAAEIKHFPAVLGEDRIFPPKRGAKGERQRVERSFETILRMAGISDFRFHDLRHTFAPWYRSWVQRSGRSGRSQPAAHCLFRARGHFLAVDVEFASHLTADEVIRAVDRIEGSVKRIYIEAEALRGNWPNSA